MLTRIRFTLTQQIVYKEDTMNHIIIILKITKNKPCSLMHISYRRTLAHFNNVHRCVLGALNHRFTKNTKPFISCIDFYQCFRPYMHQSLYVITSTVLRNYSLDTFTLHIDFKNSKTTRYFHVFATKQPRFVIE